MLIYVYFVIPHFVTVYFGFLAGTSRTKIKLNKYVVKALYVLLLFCFKKFGAALKGVSLNGVLFRKLSYGEAHRAGVGPLGNKGVDGPSGGGTLAQN